MSRPMARWTNQALLILIPLAVISGLVINLVGVDIILDPRVVHGVLGLAIVALTPWKSLVIRRGMGRQTGHRTASITLLAIVLITFVSGMLHTFGSVSRVGPLTTMQIHVGAGVLTLPLLWLHYRARPVRVRRVDWDRRTAIRAGTLAAGATAVWFGWEGGLRALGSEGADRRFTGSHEQGSGDPTRMPVTSWFDDRPPAIDAEQWRLNTGDRLWTYADLAELPVETIEATLDCTGGWYSTQTWSGIRLSDLIEAGDWESFEVRSSTGYARRYPIADLDSTLLALEVGGSPLSRGHGFPARLVVPGRRGFWWVKWVESVTPSRVPAWLQSPFPLT